MKRIKIPALFIASLIGLMSCSRDFLRPEPLSFFTAENVFVDKAGFVAQLVTLRKVLNREQTSQKNFLAHQWAASEAGVPWLVGNIDWRNLTPTSDANQRFVTQINDMYQFVKYANVIISRIDNIEWPSEAERNEILAEALWHRSYWYYRMVGNYGDIPFVGREVTGAKLDFNTHSRWAILDKLQQDMEWAVEWMVESASPGTPTKGAGNHLLAKIYLANMQWEQAVAAATRVINGPYALMRQRFGQDADDPNKNVIWDLHRPDNKNLPQNTETILAFVDRFDVPDAARSAGLYTMRVYNPSFFNINNARDNAGGIGFIDAGPMYDSLGRGNPDVVLSDWHSYDIWADGDYDWKTTPDLRRADVNWYDREEYFYNNPSSTQYGQPFDPNNLPIPEEAWARIYPTPFYKIYQPNHPEHAGQPMGGHGDWYIFRLAETYLLRAEAHYWNENPAAAAADINVVRERAGASSISAADVTIDFIFDERARELFGEEPRQNELNRVSYIMAAKGINGYSLSNIASNNWFYDRVHGLNQIYTRPGLSRVAHIEPYHFQWPIDDAMINANVLGTINQNIGYIGAERNRPPLETIEE